MKLEDALVRWRKRDIELFGEGALSTMHGPLGYQSEREEKAELTVEYLKAQIDIDDALTELPDARKNTAEMKAEATYRFEQTEVMGGISFKEFERLVDFNSIHLAHSNELSLGV